MAASVEHLILGIVALAMLIYLCWAMLDPERF